MAFLAQTKSGKHFGPSKTIDGTENYLQGQWSRFVVKYGGQGQSDYITLHYRFFKAA